MLMQPGAYVLLQRISTGPRFAVFRARREDGRPVVIKRAVSAKPELSARERLEHARDILLKLCVTGIPRPLDLITIDGLPALVLEDVGPKNLSDLIGARPLAVDSFVELAK